MLNSLQGYKADLDAMVPVKNVLFQKQNSSVFDKLCVKLNNLFARFCQEFDSLNIKKMNFEELASAKDFLTALLEFAKSMRDYKAYLISVVQQNTNEVGAVMMGNSPDPLAQSITNEQQKINQQEKQLLLNNENK